MGARAVSFFFVLSMAASSFAFIFGMMLSARGAFQTWDWVLGWAGMQMNVSPMFPKEAELAGAGAGAAALAVFFMYFRTKPAPLGARRRAGALACETMAPWPIAQRIGARAALPPMVVYQMLRVAFVDVFAWSWGGAQRPRRGALAVAAVSPAVACVMGAIVGLSGLVYAAAMLGAAGWGIKTLLSWLSKTLLQEPSGLAGIKASVGEWAKQKAKSIEARGLSSSEFAQKEREDLEREAGRALQQKNPPRL